MNGCRFLCVLCRFSAYDSRDALQPPRDPELDKQLRKWMEIWHRGEKATSHFSLIYCSNESQSGKQFSDLIIVGTNEKIWPLMSFSLKGQVKMTFWSPGETWLRRKKQACAQLNRVCYTSVTPLQIVSNCLDQCPQKLTSASWVTEWGQM